MRRSLNLPRLTHLFYHLRPGLRRHPQKAGLRQRHGKRREAKARGKGAATREVGAARRGVMSELKLRPPKNRERSLGASLCRDDSERQERGAKLSARIKSGFCGRISNHPSRCRFRKSAGCLFVFPGARAVATLFLRFRVSF